MNKEKLIIGVLVVLLIFTSIGWFLSGFGFNQKSIPYDNVYDWSEVFDGYDAYLDRDISYSTINGDSMRPTLNDGDKVLWVEASIEELNVGDIIIYDHPTKPGEKLIVHRIIDVTKNDDEYLIETKGDNRVKSDAETAVSSYYVKEEDLRGLVIGVIYFKDFSNSSAESSWNQIESLTCTITGPTSGSWSVVSSWRTG